MSTSVIINFFGPEPNYKHADAVSYVTDGRYGTMAFLDRYGYKAADNRDCNLDYDYLDDWKNAFDEGYLLHEYPEAPPMTEEAYDDLTDPDYGMDPVYHGPYYVDQKDNGRLTFLGPKVKLHGPRCHGDFKPTSCTKDWWFDTSLSYNDIVNWYE